MDSLTIENLINNFNMAKKTNSKFVGVVIKVEGLDKCEIIVNPSENFDKKLEYYKNTYDKNLNHKFIKGAKIVGFTFGDNMRELEIDFSINNTNTI